MHGTLEDVQGLAASQGTLLHVLLTAHTFQTCCVPARLHEPAHQRKWCRTGCVTMPTLRCSATPMCCRNHPIVVLVSFASLLLCMSQLQCSGTEATAKLGSHQ